MGKADVDVLRTMTRVDLLARIIELKDAVDWRGAKIAEQERVIVELRAQLGQARAKLSKHGLCDESPSRSRSTR